MALPVVWARRAPLAAAAVVALVLLVQAALGGMLVGDSVTTIAVLAVVLYSAGRYARFADRRGRDRGRGRGHPRRLRPGGGRSA